MSRFALAAVCVIVGTSVAPAQRGTGDWMTSAGDAQRSSWIRTDGKISRESLQKPGFELLWKLKFNNAARQLNSLSAPVLIDFYIGYKGFRSLGFFGGSSDTLVGVDTDLGKIEWEKRLVPVAAPAGSIPCPGGMTSGVTRPTTSAYPGPVLARGFGRSNPAKSGVGEPKQGAVTLKVPPPPPTPPPPPGAPNPFARVVQYVHALTGDGKFHSLYLSNGEEPNPAVTFLPPNANARGLIVFDKTAYVATSNNCGGVDNGVWALNLESKQVTQWKSGGNGVAGLVGPAAGPDGTLYAAGAGGELVALEKGTLRAKASYKAGVEFTSSPVVFDYKGKNLIAIATTDGRLHLLDTANLGKLLYKTPVFSSEGFAAGALASWQDSGGTRWVLAPAGGPAGEVKKGAIVAWKVVDQNGAVSMQPGWVSRDMVSPLPPLVINGVVFAASSGEFRTSDDKITAAQRAQRSSRAILYALDSATGKDLWNSGAAITSFTHSGGLSAGGSRVYISGHDGTQYAFGFAIEH